MVSKNVNLRQASSIALGIMAIILLLQAVQYAGAHSNKSSSDTGVTYTQDVPFSKESIAQVKINESSQPAYIPERRAIPFHNEPSPKELSGTAPLKPRSLLQNEPLASSLAPVLGGSFTGLSDTGWVPPDTMGAVGPLYLLEMLNGGVGIFDKNTGAPISSVSLQAFWSSLGTGYGQPDYLPFDPKVIYDQNSGRFIAVTMGGGSSPGSWLMVGISATSDPTGKWYKWAIAADKDGGVQQFYNWADYPGLGVDANYVYVTANMYSNTNTYQYGKVWVVPKTQLLNGNARITVTEFRAPTGYDSTMQPAYVFGSSSTEYLIEEGYSSSDTPPRRFLNINSITFPGGTPTWTNLGYIEVSSYPISIPSAPQLGSSNLIDTGDSRLMNAVFRNGYLWTTHTVANSANTKTEVSWYQINPATASPSSPYGTPVQQGRINDANRWYYYPSIAVNSNGDVGIGFSGSSAGEYAGAYYTARNSSDMTGTMQSVALLKAGLSPYYKTLSGNRNRWGDYSATVVDPTDNTTFWTLQEYAGTSSLSGTNLWGTWWGKFALQTVIPSLSISASSSTVTVGTPTNLTFTVTSSGSAISGATVSLSGNATGDGTTDINGNTIISVNATGTGLINATTSLTGYTSGSTIVTARAIPVLSISANLISVTAGTATNVVFTVTSNGSAVNGATVTLSGVAEGSNTTDTNGNTTIRVNATGTGLINATTSLTGYTSGSMTMTAGAIPVLSISANLTSVTAGTATNVVFTVTSNGSAVNDATVTLSGVAAGSNTTDTNGNTTISVNATGAGLINATTSLTGYTEGTTTITASAAGSPSITGVTITPTTLSAGNEINITVAINNPGASFNGRVEGNVWAPNGSGKYLGWENVVIPSGASTVTIIGPAGGAESSYIPHTAGTYLYDVILENVDKGQVYLNPTDSKTGVAFSVGAASSVYISNIVLSSAPTNGSVMTLNVTISNPTASAFEGNMSANIWDSVRGSSLTPKYISITAGSSTTLTFSYTPVNYGLHSYDFFMVNDISGDNTKAPWGFSCEDYVAGIGFNVV